MLNAVFWDVMPCGSLRTDISEERITYIIRVKIISKLGMLAVTSTPFLQQPHGVTSQKKAFFIATTVKTSNLM
jgi:hypothetical protein